MSIVFATTLQPESEPLATLTARIARGLAVPLRLVHVCEDPRASAFLGTDEEQRLGPVRATLESEARRLRDHTGAEVHAHLSGGSVVDALLSIARFELALALVVGSAQRSDRWLGTTAERVARDCTAPVLALRESHRLAAWLDGARALRVLIGADLGHAATSARAFVRTLSRLGPCEAQVVMVVSPNEAHQKLGLDAPSDEHSLSEVAERSLLRALERSAPSDEKGRLRVIAARGSADAHLSALCDREDFDLVLIGQRRKGLLEQLWYGSVARGVLRSAPVSVLSVPATKAASTRAPRAPSTVLVASDLSDCGERALDAALGVVADGGVVYVAHVLDRAKDAPAERERVWHALLRATAVEGDRPRARLVPEVLSGAGPAVQLLSFASRVGAELIVAGSREHSIAHHALIGSVARAITEGSTVPVMLVPPPPE